MKNDDYCIVELTPLKDLCVETFQFCKEMGRFVLTDQNKIIAYGSHLSIKSTNKIDNQFNKK